MKASALSRPPRAWIAGTRTRAPTLSLVYSARLRMSTGWSGWPGSRRAGERPQSPGPPRVWYSISSGGGEDAARALRSPGAVSHRGAPRGGNLRQYDGARLRLGRSAPHHSQRQHAPAPLHPPALCLGVPGRRAAGRDRSGQRILETRGAGHPVARPRALGSCPRRLSPDERVAARAQRGAGPPPVPPHSPHAARRIPRGDPLRLPPAPDERGGVHLRADRPARGPLRPPRLHPPRAAARPARPLRRGGSGDRLRRGTLHGARRDVEGVRIRRPPVAPPDRGPLRSVP